MDSMNWKHPTGRQPKTVALIALGNSASSYIGARFESDLSDAVIDVDEIWTLNRGCGVFSHDLLFVMDHIQGEADKFPRYGAYLWKHNKPIITSDNAEGWPSHVHLFPFNEIWNWLRCNANPMHGDWYHNSLAYILVYAAFIGVKELRVFGADYGNHSSGMVEDGHPCVAYWAGKLEAVGLLVKACSGSGFLGINQRGWIYGYRDDPRVVPANRGRFRALVGKEADKSSIALLSGERQVGETLEEIQPDHRFRYEWAASKISGSIIDIGAGIGYGSFLLANNDRVESVASIDRSGESIAYGKNHYFNKKITRYVADLDRKPFPIEMNADYAVAFELIEHLSDPLPLLKTIPAKKLFASVPNQDVIPYSPETAPFHHRHYTRPEFNELLQDAGWRVTSWRGQTGPMSPVLDLNCNCRTLIVEAERCQKADSSTTTAKTGD